MRRRRFPASLTLSPAPALHAFRDRPPAILPFTKLRSPLPHAPRDLPDTNLVQWLSSQIDGLKERLHETHRQLRDLQLDTVTALVAAVEAKDPLAEQHSLHVSFYAERLARLFHLSVRQTDVIRTAAVLHDIGKIGVPDAILTKPGPLTAEEYQVVKQHPVTGAAILRSAACLQRELPLVLHHHEWYDGVGYPAGLRDEEIPFGARILHVADAVDAMLSPRTYKKGCGLDYVRCELRRGRGAQFDPIIADAALDWLCRCPEEVAPAPDPRPFAVPRSSVAGPIALSRPATLTLSPTQ